MNRFVKELMSGEKGNSTGFRVSPNRLVGFACGALVFIWPFIFFRAFLFSHSPIVINNDFNVLYYSYKAYLLDSLAGGHFPLWSPGEGAGFPFVANPFTQALYPLNIPLLLVHKALGGYTFFDHQKFSLLGASLFGLGLYFWLKELLPSRRGALFAALVFSIGFKVGDILRFPNAVHAAAWLPWILYGVAKARESRNFIKSALILFVGCLLLLTAGYPYYCYYALFLIPPYVVLLLFSKTRLALHNKVEVSPVSNLRFLLTCLIPAASALLLCAPYYIKMFQLFNHTAGREGDSYEYATANIFNGFDTLGSLIFPPAAQAEGWYFFGFAGLFLFIIYSVGVFLEMPNYRRERLLLTIILIWFTTITFITYGKSSYLFDFLYTYLPGFDRLRVWGRLNIVLVPILALGLGKAYLYFESILGDDKDNRLRRTRCFKIALPATLSIGLLQSWLYTNDIYDYYWSVLMRYLGGREWQFIVMNLSAGLLLAGILFFSSRRPFSSLRARCWLVILLSGWTFWELTLFGGARQWIIINNVDSNRARNDISEYFERSFAVPRVRKYFTLKLPHFNVGAIDNWYFTDYQAFYGRIFDNFGRLINADKLPHFDRLMGITEAKRIFISESIDQSSIEDFLLDSERTEAARDHGIELLQYDGDNLELMIDTPVESYVSFIDNWDPDWKAYINGSEVPIEKLFGTFKSIHVKPGINHIKFSYEPFSFF